jgi:hypothetical protein
MFDSDPEKNISSAIKAQFNDIDERV